MNDTDTLIKYIYEWSQEIIETDKLNKWIMSTEATKKAHETAIIDELLGENSDFV